MKLDAMATWRGGPDGSGEVTVGEGHGVPTYNPGSASAPAIGANPETLLCSSVATCFSITLGYLAERYGFTEARVHATATMGKGADGRQRVLGIALVCSFSPAGLDRAKLAEAVQRAEKGCVIARSIAAAVPVTATLAAP